MTTLVSLPTNINSEITIVPHEEYSAIRSTWILMNDAYATNLQRCAHSYISPPPGVFQADLNKNNELIKTTEKLIIPIAEGSGWPQAAIAYILGGFEPDLIPRTLKGFTSLVSQFAPTVKLPSQLEYLNEEATKDNKTLDESYLRAVRRVLLKGRVPLLLDIQDNKLKLIEYKAEALIDWDTLDNSSDSSLFKYAIFEDTIENPNFNPITDNSERYFSVYYYHHIDNGVYKVTKIVNSTKYEGLQQETITPKLLGKTLNYIPLVALGSIDNTPDVDAIPLLGIANCSVAMLDLSCMLKHAEKASAVPTMYITGVDADDAPQVTGAGVCMVFPDYQARVGYTTTDTSAMAHIEGRIEGYYAQAQELGASLLGSTRHGTESGEALRLRQASSTATLRSIVENVGKGFKRILQMAADWRAVDVKSVVFEPNKEFSTFSLTANETVALTQTWQAGAIAHSTLLENFRKAGMLKAGETVEDEQTNLEKAGEKYVEPVDQSSKSKNALDIAESLPKANTFNNNL